jgi:aminoglycoside 3-N-acetyltransferase I
VERLVVDAANPPRYDLRMPASFDVQRLMSADLPLVRALNALFGEAFSDPETYGAQRPTDAYLHALLGKEHVIALVALVDGQVVGGLVAYELEKFEQARREIYIYDLAVAEAHRRRGIATALIERLRGIATARGACAVFVQADYGDDPAIALYEKLGARKEVLHFDIKLIERRRPAL